jgi:hypothetical protein
VTRTTVDIEAPILRELKALGHKEGRSLGKLISELVAEALARRHEQPHSAPPTLSWISKPMHSTIDWADTDALAAILDQDDREKLAGDTQAPRRRRTGARKESAERPAARRPSSRSRDR